MNNYEYLYSVLNLYLNKENDVRKTNLHIFKANDKVTFGFNMKEKDLDKTTCDIPFNDFMTCISKIIAIYKNDIMIIDEKYDYNNINQTCYYYVKLKNGRILSFDGFSVLEVNNIRNILYNINTYKEEIRVKLEKEDGVSMNYKPALQETGFISFKYIALIVGIFSLIFVLSLWACKLLMK